MAESIFSEGKARAGTKTSGEIGQLEKQSAKR